MSRNHRRNRRIKRKRRKGWIWIVLILVAMLAAAGFWMLGRNYEGAEKMSTNLRLPQSGKKPQKQTGKANLRMKVRQTFIFGSFQRKSSAFIRVS